MSNKIFIYRNVEVVVMVLDGITYSKSCKTVENAKITYNLAEKLRLAGDLEGLKELFSKYYAMEKKGCLIKTSDGAWYHQDVPWRALPTPILEKYMVYLEEGLPTEALENFWKLLCLNPDPVVRETLFNFAEHYDFPITSNGYFIGYKTVRMKDINLGEKASLISSEYMSALVCPWESPETKSMYFFNVEGTVDKIAWFKQFSKEEIQEDDNVELDWDMIEITTSKKHAIDVMTRRQEGDLLTGLVEVSLKVAFEEILGAMIQEANDDVFTDIYSGTTSIKLGKPVKEHRDKCDNNPENGCSHGLHVGTPDYVLDYGSVNDPIMTVLVNPMNVVSVPKDYSYRKLRCSEYFPFAINKRVGRSSFELVKAEYFENDYMDIEKEEMEEALKEMYKDDLELSDALNTFSVVYTRKLN